jgi:hypothetical protein
MEWCKVLRCKAKDEEFCQDGEEEDEEQFVGAGQ